MLLTNDLDFRLEPKINEMYEELKCEQKKLIEVTMTSCLGTK
jgi:hypothetical protein